jgi:tubulin beta
MSIFPSENISDTPVDVYNATLSIHLLLENVDSIYVVQNESLYNLLHQKARLICPTFDDFNYIIAGQLSDMSSCLRFKSEQSK